MLTFMNRCVYAVFLQYYQGARGPVLEYAPGKTTESLRTAIKMREVRCMGFRVNPFVFIVSILSIWSVVIVAVANPTMFFDSASGSKRWITQSFTWLFIGAQNTCVLYGSEGPARECGRGRASEKWCFEEDALRDAVSKEWGKGSRGCVVKSACCLHVYLHRMFLSVSI